MKINRLIHIFIVLLSVVGGQSCEARPRTLELPNGCRLVESRKGIVRLHAKSGEIYPNGGNIIGFMVSKDYCYGWYSKKKYLGKDRITFFIACLSNGTITEYHDFQRMKRAVEKLNMLFPNMSEEITFAAIFGPDEKRCRKTLSKNGMAITSKGINFKQIHPLVTD